MTKLTQRTLKHIKTLRTKKGRKQSGLYVVEGIRTLEEAKRHGIMPKHIVAAESTLGDRGRALLDWFVRQGVDALTASARHFSQLSDHRAPQGLMGVFGISQPNPDQLYDAHVRTVLVCDNISDPGNMGTLLRSAAAFGFRRVALLGNCVDVYSPKVVRSTAGALFAILVAPLTQDDIDRLVKKRAFRLIAASAGAGAGIGDLLSEKPPDRLMLAVGSEAQGLSAKLLESAHNVVQIEQEPATESLNAAVAGSILMNRMYEWMKT